MIWIVEKCSLPGWEKSFPTEEQAIAELRSHICAECLDGVLTYVDPDEPDGLGFEHRKKPDPNSPSDLLSTPCGCEYEMTEDRP